MKTFFYTCIFIHVISSISAQNISNLDTKYGINKFKLESSFELYKNELEFKASKKDVKYYSYKNINSIKIFNEDVNQIWLGFYKNKLYTISIDLKTTDNSKQIENLKKMENLFGEASEGETKNTEYDWAYQWKTSKVYLGFNRVSCKFEFKPCTAHIYMISYKLHYQIENDSF